MKLSANTISIYGALFGAFLFNSVVLYISFHYTRIKCALEADMHALKRLSSTPHLASITLQYFRDGHLQFSRVWIGGS
jgi:hypothetical protein